MTARPWLLALALALLAATAVSCGRPECEGDLTYALTGETTSCPACLTETPYAPTLDADPDARPARVLIGHQTRGPLLLDVDGTDGPRSLWPLLADSCDELDVTADGNISPDGSWLVFESKRTDICGEDSCVARALVDDPSTLEALNTETGYVRWTTGVAIDDSGETIAAAMTPEGGDDVQIHIVRRWCDGWCAPEVMSVDSPYAFNGFPHLTADGGLIAYSCGAQEYGGNEVCRQVASGDAPVSRVLLDKVVYDGDTATILGDPVFTSSGDLVFAATTGGAERLWRVEGDPEENDPQPIRPTHVADSYPCVLADGRIVSVWYGDGVLDEGLKVMDQDGDDVTVRDPGMLPASIAALHCGGGG